MSPGALRTKHGVAVTSTHQLAPRFLSGPSPAPAPRRALHPPSSAEETFGKFCERVCAGAVPLAKGDEPIIFTSGELIAHFPRNLWAIKISEPFYSFC